MTTPLWIEEILQKKNTIKSIEHESILFHGESVGNNFTEYIVGTYAINPNEIEIIFEHNNFKNNSLHKHLNSKIYNEDAIGDGLCCFAFNNYIYICNVTTATFDDNEKYSVEIIFVKSKNELLSLLENYIFQGYNEENLHKINIYFDKNQLNKSIPLSLINKKNKKI